LRTASQSTRRAEFEQRLRFEMLLAEICAEFVDVDSDALDARIENALRLICECLGVNHSSVWQVSECDPGLLVMTHAYRDPNLKPLPARPLLRDYFPWIQSKVLNREVVSVPNTKKVPLEAAKDMDSWLQYGVGATLAFPLSVGSSSVIGLLAFDSLREREWPEPLQRRLQILAHVLTQALDRKLAERARLGYAAIVESSEDAIVSKTVDGIVVSWNKGAQNIYGYTEAEVVGNSITVLVPRELVDEEKKILEAAKLGQRIEHYETVRISKAGKRTDVSLSLSPIRDSGGKIVGLSSISRDITERKVAERALADVTRKLIQAQEQERSRIARELHDDISQQIALIHVSLEKSEQRLCDDDAEIRDAIHLTRQRLSNLGRDVQALSHQLHSSKLDYLGLASAARALCREIADQHKVEISFSEAGIPRNLSKEASLCLFRILQEALHNAVKHSGVRRIAVELHSESQQIQLSVRDRGVGFDPQEALKRGGLGLISMRERVQAFGGGLSINSRAGEGTTVTACVPLTSNVIQSERMEAAG
jgi:PAS domain S-box-containing protein